MKKKEILTLLGLVIVLILALTLMKGLLPARNELKANKKIYKDLETKKSTAVSNLSRAKRLLASKNNELAELKEKKKSAIEKRKDFQEKNKHRKRLKKEEYIKEMDDLLKKYGLELKYTEGINEEGPVNIEYKVEVKIPQNSLGGKTLTGYQVEELNESATAEEKALYEELIDDSGLVRKIKDPNAKIFFKKDKSAVFVESDIIEYPYKILSIESKISALIEEISTNEKYMGRYSITTFVEGSEPIVIKGSTGVTPTPGNEPGADATSADTTEKEKVEGPIYITNNSSESGVYLTAYPEYIENNYSVVLKLTMLEV